MATITSNTLEWAREDDGRPALIVLRTRIGDPAPTKGGTAKAHGAPLGADEVKRTKAILGWPDEKFHVAAEAMAAAPLDGSLWLSSSAIWTARLVLGAGMRSALGNCVASQWRHCVKTSSLE